MGRMWSDADPVNATKIVIDISSAFACKWKGSLYIYSSVSRLIKRTNYFLFQYGIINIITHYI